jgi:UDP-N-acetyl-D-mannosaminuronate dehydrogenase
MPRDLMLNKLQSRRATIGIVGPGHVGLPLLLRYNEAGLAVHGFDVVHGKVAKRNTCISFIEHIGLSGRGDQSRQWARQVVGEFSSKGGS